MNATMITTIGLQPCGSPPLLVLGVSVVLLDGLFQVLMCWATFSLVNFFLLAMNSFAHVFLPLLQVNITTVFSLLTIALSTTFITRALISVMTT